MRVALYARYSTDMQSDTSAADQLAVLRRAVASRGWTEVKAYADEGISGTALGNRPNARRLMRDAADGMFDVVLTEHTDRLSRGQGDLARMFELLSFYGVSMQTLSSGVITEIHIALEGAMNRLQVVNGAKKTHRGLSERVAAGFSAGGLCYGYVKVSKGVLAVDEAQKAVVRQVYRDYAAGASARTIATRLNAAGVPGPRGTTWCANSIIGDRRAQDGLLSNELYIGIRVWNRRRFRKHPETGRRSSVLNPPAEWIRKAAPELRIVDDELWAAVRAREAAIAASPNPRAHAPKRLFSGLIHCGACGAPMWLQGGRYNCSKSRSGACDNTKIIKALTVEGRVLAGVRRHMLTPQAIAKAVRHYQEEREASRAAAVRDRLPIEKELAEVARRIDRAADSYERGLFELDELEVRLKPLRARQAELKGRLALCEDPQPVRLHPRAADFYRDMAAELEAALEENEDVEHLREILRMSITRIDFFSAEGLGAFDLRIHGTLAALLGISKNTETSHPEGCEVELGAGTRFGRNLTPLGVAFAA